MDFVHDQLVDGRGFRVLTVVDQGSRQRPLLEVGQRVTGGDVAAAVARARQAGMHPRSITVDHGTEFTSMALDNCAVEHRITLNFTRPDKPTDNGHIEFFKTRFRDACLNVHPFPSLAHAKTLIEAWRVDDNEHRLHGSLGGLPPAEYATIHQDTEPPVAT